ncbi:MAG: hypothetical protein IPF66_04800 [Holophagales bacterium]|nr:hypothetical protein [Holophagales bacterium]
MTCRAGASRAPAGFQIDGYHCWAEFWAEGKWWTVDISEADKYTALPPAPVLAHRRPGFSRGGRAGARRRG